MLIMGADVSDLLKEVQRLHDIQKKKADETIPKIMKIEQCKGLDFHQSSLDSRDGWGNARTNETVAQWDAGLARFNGLADQALDGIERRHEENKQAIQNNTLIKEKVSLIMRELGIPGSFQERDYNSRAIRPKYNTRPAGYIGDLDRNVPISDGYEQAKKQVEEAKKRAAEFHKKQVASLAQKEKEAAEEKKKIADEQKLVHLRVKYGCEFNSTANDVRRAILEKDKYLWLAHWMERNRLDWSDGCDYAMTGLNGFKVETLEDREIYQAVESRCIDWDGDGRVFRDMEHNYNEIYARVTDTDLMKDYQAISEMCEQDDY